MMAWFVSLLSIRIRLFYIQKEVYNISSREGGWATPILDLMGYAAQQLDSVSIYVKNYATGCPFRQGSS